MQGRKITAPDCTVYLSTVKEEIFVGEMFHTFLHKTVRTEFNFVLSG